MVVPSRGNGNQRWSPPSPSHWLFIPASFLVIVVLAFNLMDMKRALHDLGVRDDTLTREEKGTLDRDGFLPLPGILTPDQAERMGARLDELVAQGESVRHQEGVESLDA